MSEIFISYRRSDSEGWAGRLAEALEEAFGGHTVFFDYESIPPGANWHRKLQQEISDAKLLIAVIGPLWLGAEDSLGCRRLDDPEDLVRFELVTAITRGITLLPILVGNASLPKVSELPQSLQGLLAYQALEMPTPRWEREIQSLFEVAERTLGRPRVQTRNTAPKITVAENLSLVDVEVGDIAGVKGSLSDEKLGNIEVGKGARIRASKVKDIVGLKITRKKD